MIEHYRPAEFLPRLQPRTGGVLPRGFAQRWFGRAAGLDVAVFSTRPAAGVSQHLVADRFGHWFAYEHAAATRRRRAIGWSARGRARLAKAFV